MPFQQFDTILVTPVAPHTLALRPTILPADAVLRIEVEEASDAAVVAFAPDPDDVVAGYGKILTKDLIRS
mgnify:CR=1 FL=1